MTKPILVIKAGIDTTDQEMKNLIKLLKSMEELKEEYHIVVTTDPVTKFIVLNTPEAVEMTYEEFKEKLELC